MRLLGLGTEKVESAVRALFPRARVARMDRDTTARKGSVLKILKDLENGAIDILIGTQMVAKGHDFPNITLVGIVCADLSLSFPDFRAAERTFQLLAQVSGRAGRGSAPGRAILQTYTPDHFSILSAKNQDFKSFYREDIHFRKTLRYPPFSRMILLRISGKDRKQTAQHARIAGDFCQVAKEGDRSFSQTVEVMGPIESAIPRVAGRYRWQILLKGLQTGPLHRYVRKLLSENPSLTNNRNVKITVDVDPFLMM
jgi:primosomal protein N' (replication factor Y) (superfamily II helicase)